MDAAAIAALINTIANVITIAAPLVIKAEQNAQPFAAAIADLFKGTHFTDEQITELLAKSNALSLQIQAVLPPEDEQDV
jgi:hypothetical protein